MDYGNSIYTLKNDWTQAMQRGDTTAAQDIHDRTDDFRRQYGGYTGGADGSGYIGAFRIGAGALGGTAAAFAYGYSTLLAAGSPTLFSWYPPGAALGLARYRAYDPAARYDLTACACSLALAAAVSALLVSTLQEKEPRNARTVSERKPTKKGW